MHLRLYNWHMHWECERSQCRSHGQCRRFLKWMTQTRVDNKTVSYRYRSSNVRQIFGFTSQTSRSKVYKRKELVGYSMQQMYDVVADVDNYKSFVPYCNKSLVYQRTESSAKADVVVGFPPLCEAYTSNLTMQRPNLVKAECFDGRLFHYLQNYWGFSAGLKDVPNSCVIDFRVTFEFKSALHSQLSQIFFDLIVQQMESAFVREAQRRYGGASIKPLLLSLEKSWQRC